MRLMFAAVAIAAMIGSGGSAEAISQTGITAPFLKFYSLIESKSKGAPCSCVVPASITGTVDKLVPGMNRTPIELVELPDGKPGFFTIPLGPGATNYLYVPEVEEDAICDVFGFVPYIGTKVYLGSCQTPKPE